MAGSKARKKGKRKKSKAKSGGLVQKAVVGLCGAVLVLCTASITYSFFFRLGGESRGSRQFRIEVLNGTGKAGLAHEAKRGLLRRGIDVIDASNADHFGYEQSVLIARKRDADVETLGRLLGCNNVVVQLREGTLEDATLVLGADYEELRLDWGLETDLAP